MPMTLIPFEQPLKEVTALCLEVNHTTLLRIWGSRNSIMQLLFSFPACNFNFVYLCLFFFSIN